MFLLINYFLAGKVRLDYIFEASIISKQSEFDNMVTKLLPLHSLIAVDINLLKKINKSKCQILLKLLIPAIILKVLKHDR